MIDLTTEELAETLAVHHAIWFRRNPTASIVQTCLIFREDGEQVAVPCGWGNEFERQLMVGILRATMIAESAVRYAIWSEVWMVTGGFPDDYRHGDLARSPDRVEAVFTLVVEASGAMAVRLQKIIRGKNGGVRRLEPLEGPLTDVVKGFGVLGDLLPERTFN